jgi:plasmid stabilization system protein ParE
MRLVWFDQAELDIVEHIHFIELRNPSAAIEQDFLVENAVGKLAFFLN